MAFDVFLQAFRGGDAARGDGDAALAILVPLIVARGEAWADVSTIDGRAEVYGIDDPHSGMMFTHASGRAVWDLIYQVANAAGFVVMPVGCDIMILNEDERSQLPVEFVGSVTVIGSGADLLAAIQRDGA